MVPAREAAVGHAGLFLSFQVSGFSFSVVSKRKDEGLVCTQALVFSS